MDVERTIEFILQNQANSETRMAAMQTQMVGMQKLVQAGMRMLVKQGENLNKLAVAQKELAGEVKELAKAQRATETKLQGFIDSLRRGGNGRHSRN